MDAQLLHPGNLADAVPDPCNRTIGCIFSFDRGRKQILGLVPTAELLQDIQGTVVERH
jgi:hypothetical protein